MLYLFGAANATGFIALFGLSSVFYFCGSALLLRVPRR
jgi:hypothetical protein